jgi:molybdenum cofactor biosynthesis enzyme MoaA
MNLNKKEGKKVLFKPDVVPPGKKLGENILPFLSFPITVDCPFHCLYCGECGEATASYKPHATLEFVKERVSTGYEYGIRKFRLTGGEPMVHPDFQEMVEFISNLPDVYLLINTNGLLIHRNRDWFFSLNDNVKFAVSLDTLNPDKFDMITGTSGLFDDVIEGIHILAESGNLYRINMVVNAHNAEDVFPMIDFCRSIGCDIKLLEVCSVPIPYNEWEDFFTNMAHIEKQLVDAAGDVEAHQYSRSFGIPMPIYDINGVKVTVKASSYGAQYDTEGICKGCSYYPCHEGVYDLYLIPDGRLCGCRWSESSVAKGDTFYSHLVYLARAFQRARWEKRGKMKIMPPNPTFVQHARDGVEIEANHSSQNEGGMIGAGSGGTDFTEPV